MPDIEEKTKRFMENLKADERYVQSYFDHPKVKRYMTEVLNILMPE